MVLVQKMTMLNFNMFKDMVVREGCAETDDIYITVNMLSLFNVEECIEQS